MQRSELILKEKLGMLIDSIFEGQPTVFESYSKYDLDTCRFDRAEDLKIYVESERSKGECFIDLAIHYPATKGFVYEQQISLNSAKFNGAKLRFRTSGWGLIHFQLDFRASSKLECRIAVNSEKRALGWSSTYPDLQSPALWDWKMVETNARRLIRVLRKCS
ncbi:hypothetical protein ACE02D_08145 [Shewanella bicestrii]|uniref:hypothetical protein n=1 Tax=Shewanella mangrovisoli TaxID=2864211 RepID=UPI0001261363|nr:hypothetical protein [Shewanella mangrovisoli]QYK09060.1 hypothetical protein K0H60_20060 [Shewanella mangrovisoli]